MLAVRLGVNIADGALQNLQHALPARPLPKRRGDGTFSVFARDLVDFVDVNNPRWARFTSVVRVLQQPQNNIFHVFTT